MGCVAGLFYSLWQITEWIASLAASLLDFFVYYSTNSSSYTSDFISKGWGIIRDIANIFFIIALLYIAIKTILSLNVSDNKKLISSIIIVALVINFSLFFTQVIIDGSNILAKVFYNQIESIDKNGNPLTATQEYKSISVSLVKAYDPQQIISSKEQYDNSVSTFIFITILLIFLTLYAAYMFAVVSILFVSRVVSLWICMIFAPLAFASYSFKFELPFGHKEWWDTLLKNAFLAPIFIFFLYIILLFANLNKTISYLVINKDDISPQGLITSLMATIIPFAISFILLTKAKELAVKYSGEMGKTLSKGVGMVTGTAAVGMAANLAANYVGKGARATVGKAGSKMANSSWMNKWASYGMGGNWAKTMMTKVGTGSMDVRGIKIAGKGLSNVPGMQKLGAAKGVGGYDKMRADKVEKRKKRADAIKVGKDEPMTKEINKAEMDLQVLLNKSAGAFEKIDKKLTALRQDKQDASTPQDKADISVKIKAEMDLKKAMKKGTAAVGKDKDGKDIFAIVKEGIYAGKTIDDLDNSQTGIIPELKTKKETESRRRTTQFANTIRGRGGAANKEAQHSIIMETKLDSGTKTH
jgi:hypothetical protein